MDTKPAFGEDAIHGRGLGVMKVGENRGLVGGFGEVVHEFEIGFGAGDMATEGLIFGHWIAFRF